MKPNQFFIDLEQFLRNNRKRARQIREGEYNPEG